MGIHTNFWGPGAWEFLHSITFNYPNHPTPKEKQQTRQFFHLLKYVLPCERCRQHYTEGIEKIMPIEPHLKNQETLSRWLVRFHNTVNKRLGKPIMSYDSVREKYQAMQGKCQIHEISTCQKPEHSTAVSTTKNNNNTNNNSNTHTIIWGIVIGLLLGLLFVLIIWHKRCISSLSSASFSSPPPLPNQTRS